MNILIIGLGSIAKKHINVILEINPEAIIYAFRSSENPKIVGNVINLYSLKELSFSPDFIIISNPSYLHENAIIESLRFKCPLFIEKPVLTDITNVEKVFKAVKSADVFTYVACNMRFHPAIQFLKKYLNKEKRINEVNIYCGSYLPDWRQESDFRTIYSAHADMGGGVHLDLIHELDYCIWLFGIPEKVTSLKRSVSSLQLDSIDYANFNFIYSSFTANITLNYFRRDPKREIEIILEEDTLIIDLLKNNVYSKVSEEFLFNEPFNILETYLKQMRYFINRIQMRETGMNDIYESIVTLKLALHET